MPPKASTSSSSSSQLITPALSIQEYLKLLTSGSLTSLQAVTASQKLYKSYKNLESLSQLSQNDLVETHGLDESIAKGILELTSKGKGKKGKGKAASGKKRKVDQGADESMIKPPREVIESEFTFDEYEVEEALYAKSVVINRSPCMVAWAFIVCERLGFTRSESLSIAHVYNELNAISKGVAIGIMPASANRQVASNDQPYIDLMGRKIPVLKLKSGEWRALSKGEVTEPAKAFGYMTRAFRQQLGAVISAMRMLANAFTLDDLNKRGYSLYCDFRPDVNNGPQGWGAKGTVAMKTILNLRPVIPKPVEKVKKEEEKKEKIKKEAGVKQEGGVKKEDEDEEGGGEGKKARVRGNKRVKLEEVDLTFNDEDDDEKKPILSSQRDEFDDALDDGFDDVVAGAE